VFTDRRVRQLYRGRRKSVPPGRRVARDPAVCNVCNRVMLDALSCTLATVRIDGQDFERIHYGSEPGSEVDPNDRCNDCGVARGGLHHPRCDREDCPKCGAQALGDEHMDQPPWYTDPA
jgi:hypothetical protein